MSSSIDEEIVVEKDCEGCVTIWHLNLGSQCLCSLIEGCPCLHCLVKTMCINMCDDLEIHIEKAKRRLAIN